MLRAKELSQADIQEILSLRGKMPQAEIRKKFGIGTSRLYRIWNNGGENSSQAAAAAAAKGQAPASNGKGQAATLGASAPADANGKEARAPADANGKEARAPAGQAATPGKTAGANSQRTDAEVLLALGRIEEQLGRLEKQQALLLDAQESHYEDVEELEDTVEQIAEDGANILDNLEAGSQQARTTMENLLVVAKAARDIGLVLLGFGGLGLLLWTLSWRVATKTAKEKATQDSTREPPPTEPKVATPAPAGPVAPHKPKRGIQAME